MAQLSLLDNVGVVILRISGPKEAIPRTVYMVLGNHRPLETVVSPQGFRSKDRAQKQSGSTFASRQRGRGDPSDPRPKRGDPKDRISGPWEPETIVKSGKTSVRDASGLSSLKLCGLTKPFDAY